ncbi:hypothetical protein [Pseudorhodoferax sp. Leaf274]|uniref:hypothetical protein n=1 Tax=Pseudorhodoferax sp. Leaf274 TaxID=1736318 RepID=UPI00070375FC|nr:hypothetical protein [Pseudorhodoferax sp. Leaf274]KQP49520.1 hypothetical protein ASF44_02700 [Pseudorhodoferax sp. Leaf274]
MQSVLQGLGNQRYAQLREWLDRPAQRVQRILQVTAADWWPDGEVPQTRKAAGRVARAHREREHAQAARGRRHA